MTKLVLINHIVIHSTHTARLHKQINTHTHTHTDRARLYGCVFVSIHDFVFSVSRLSGCVSLFLPLHPSRRLHLYLATYHRLVWFTVSHPLSVSLHARFCMSTCVSDSLSTYVSVYVCVFLLALCFHLQTGRESDDRDGSNRKDKHCLRVRQRETEGD